MENITGHGITSRRTGVGSCLSVPGHLAHHTPRPLMLTPGTPHTNSQPSGNVGFQMTELHEKQKLLHIKHRLMLPRHYRALWKLTRLTMRVP